MDNDTRDHLHRAALVWLTIEARAKLHPTTAAELEATGIVEPARPAMVRGPYNRAPVEEQRWQLTELGHAEAAKLFPPGPVTRRPYPHPPRRERAQHESTPTPPSGQAGETDHE